VAVSQHGREQGVLGGCGGRGKTPL